MAKILVIEDEDDQRLLVGDVLVAAGHRVYLAAHGFEGMAIQQREVADLVICDLLMPEKEGIETIRDLRAEFPALKIIAMSGGGGEPYLATAVDLGADLVLQKPFDSGELMAVVDRLLAMRTR